MKITKERLKKIIKEEIASVVDEGFFSRGKPSEEKIEDLRQKMLAAGKAGDFQAYDKASRNYLDAVSKRPDMYKPEQAKETVYSLDQKFGFARDQ